MNLNNNRNFQEEHSGDQGFDDKEERGTGGNTPDHLSVFNDDHNQSKSMNRVRSQQQKI